MIKAPTTFADANGVDDFRSRMRTEGFVAGVPSTAASSDRALSRVVPLRPAGRPSVQLVGMSVAELAERMSGYLGIANRPATSSTAAGRRAQAERVRAEFREVFEADLRRACGDLVRHGVMTEHEDKIVHLALEGSTFGLHAVAALLADRARQLVSPSGRPVSR